MDGPAQLDELMPQLMGIVDGLSADQLDDKTPCAAFTVTGVLQHMVSGAEGFAPAFRGEDPPADAGELGTGDVRDRWRTAVGGLGDAMQHEGAMDRTLQTPFGPMLGSEFTRYLAFDGLMHAWDLATATGQGFAPREELVREVDRYARGLITSQFRDGDTFAAETTPPADAGPLERLVAFSGRQLP